MKTSTTATTPRADKVILVGQMGAGKSTVARLLAQRWPGFAACDLDHEIEARGRTIAEVFAADGEAGFRALEAETLERVLARDERIIVATGGGAPCREGAIERMRDAGPVIWLTVPPAILAARLTTSSPTTSSPPAPATNTVRPLLAGLDLQDAERFLTRQLDARRPFYARADVTIDASSPPDLVALAIDRAVLGLVDLGA